MIYKNLRLTEREILFQEIMEKEPIETNQNLISKIGEDAAKMLAAIYKVYLDYRQTTNKELGWFTCRYYQVKEINGFDDKKQKELVRILYDKRLINWATSGGRVHIRCFQFYLYELERYKSYLLK